MENGERLLLTRIRGENGLRPSQLALSSKQALADYGKSLWGQTIQMIMDDKRNPVKNILEETRDHLIDERCLEPRPAWVSADYLLILADAVYSLAWRDFLNSRIPSFTGNYDIGYGIATIGMNIALAGMVEANGIKQLGKKFVSDPQTHEAVILNALFVKGLYDQDQGKGLVLADTYLEVLRGNTHAPVTPIGPHHIREVVVAGAELGADLYKKIYPLAESLLR